MRKRDCKVGTMVWVEPVKGVNMPYGNGHSDGD